MAFLCPSRRGRQKKKHKEPKPPFLGRITGSSSVDTLVRVGLEKQHGLTPDARMCVAQDFLATTHGELTAHRGDHVYRLYVEGDWVYVITELGQEGFVPSFCLVPEENSQSQGKASKKKGKNDDVTHKNLQRDATNLDFEKKSLHDSTLSSAVYNIKSAEREKGFVDISMQADEGSDNSSIHSHSSSLRHKTNPLPKPARIHNIPDVISTTSDSVNFDKQTTPTIIAAALFHQTHNANQDYKIPTVSSDVKTKDTKLHINSDNNNNNNNNNNTHTNNNRLHRYKRSDNQTNSNVLGLPDREPGARHSHTSNGDSITEVKTFVKKPGRKIVVVFPFHGVEENDLIVQRGELVSVLNEKDPDWVWVKTKNGNEGFVPTRFTCPLPEDLLKSDDAPEAVVGCLPVASPTDRRTQVMAGKSRTSNQHDIKELQTSRNFEAQSSDDISVRAGEQVFADLANQIEEDWLWVYAPATQSYGYIPKENVIWPSTSTRTSTPSKNSMVQKRAIENLDVKSNSNIGKPV